jgi:hypothetical protein
MLFGPRLLLRRARAQRLVLTAAVATVVLATVLLCGLSLYGDRAADGGVRQALEPSAPRTVTISAPTSARQLQDQDRAVAEVVGRELAEFPSSTYRAVRSGSFGLPGPTANGRPDLATFHHLADLEQHADLTAGTWPADRPAAGAPPGAPARVSTAVPEPVAAALGLAPGSVVRLTDRLTGDPVEAVVAGVFRPRDPADAYWALNPYGESGVQRGSYVTYGPFAVGRATFAARFADGASGTWLVLPDTARLRAGQVADLRAALLGLVAGVQGHQSLRGAANQSPAAVRTGLPDRLEQIDRGLVASRSILLVPMLQLALLAGYALVFTARLLDERRRVEHALLRARGGSVRQLAGLAVRESLLVTLPAAVVSPPLATALLRWASSAGGLKSAGVSLDSGLAAGTWLLALAVAATATVLLAAPLLRPGGSWVTGQGVTTRPARRSGLQRAGADVALLVVALLGYWELRRYSSPVHTIGDSGALHVDPLLVAAPTLGMLAGGLLALRLLPVASRLAERVTARSRRLAAPLGTWQVSRRPLRQSGPVLLLALALAIGTFAATYSASWVRSQQDQADLRAGADLRVASPQGPDALPALGQHAVYGGLAGVRALTPVGRHAAALGATSTPATVLGLDASRAGAVVRLREDLAPGPAAGVLRPLAAARNPLPGLVLPGRPVRLGFDLRLASTAVPTRLAPVDLSAVLADGDGLVHRVRLGAVPADGRARTVQVPLGGSAGPRRWAATGPLTLVGLGFDYTPPPDAAESVDLQVASVRTADRADGRLGAPVRAAGPAWARGPDPGGGDPTRPSPPRPTVLAAPGLLTRVLLTIDPGMAGGHAEATTAGPADEAAALPAVVDAAAARAGGLGTGDVVVADLGTYRLKVRVVGQVERWPTVDTPGGVMLVDLPSLAASGYRTAAAATTAQEWWIATADAAAAAALSPPALAGGVTVRRQVADDLRNDPLGSGVRVALLGGFAAAALLAAIGYALHLGVAGWERRNEFAVLRALGADRREIGTLVAVEQAFLLGAGTVSGLALGLAVAWLVVPLVTLSAEATRVVPPVLVTVPWATLALITGTAVVAMGSSTLALAAAARQADLARVLRAGGDR